MFTNYSELLGIQGNIYIYFFIQEYEIKGFREALLTSSFRAKSSVSDGDQEGGGVSGGILWKYITASAIMPLTSSSQGHVLPTFIIF